MKIPWLAMLDRKTPERLNEKFMAVWWAPTGRVSRLEAEDVVLSFLAQPGRRLRQRDRIQAPHLAPSCIADWIC